MPVKGALEAVARVVEKVSNSDLIIKIDDYLKLMALCVTNKCFTFNDRECVQHRALGIGSPLSAVMASLFMESLEQEVEEPLGSGMWMTYWLSCMRTRTQPTNSTCLTVSTATSVSQWKRK